MNPFPQPRSAVLAMAPYHPPTAGRGGKLRLDFNENTQGCSPRVLRALKLRASREGLAVYPEYGEALEKLDAFFQRRPGELLLTNGTDEAIHLVLSAYLDAGQTVLLLSPSYAMYRFYSELAGAAVEQAAYRPADLSFPVEELLEKITPRTRVVLIANPNNPTGTAAPPGAIARILEKAAHSAVLIDEAYFEFHGATALGLIDDHPNLFVSRTFSKVYGMAGLRLGCLFSRAENIAVMRKAQSPYSVSWPAVWCALEAIEDRDYVDRYVREALESRRMLCRGLDRMGIGYYPSEASFVLVQAGPRAGEISARLREHGVLVRDRSYELPGCIRVTVGRKAHARRFLAAFREALR